MALIEALVGAGQAGADIDLIVRGACMLPPGVPGATERIRVRSIVGRFLEHSRIAYFRWGAGDDDEALYLSSADWMGRNMFGRIEVGLAGARSPRCASGSSTNAWCRICSTARMRGRWRPTAATVASPAAGRRRSRR